MKTFYTFLLMLFSGAIAWGQDLHLSQFFASPMGINPAMTGMYQGNYNVYLQHRQQWNTILNHPFVSQTAAYDQPDKKYGYGGFISDSKSGVGGLHTMNALASAAYQITIDPSGIHNLTVGLQLGIVYKGINTSALTFENQYSTANGTAGFDQSLPSGENFTKTSYVAPLANAGVYYSYKNIDKKYTPYFGVAGFNLNTPRETYFGGDNQLPRRLLVHGGVKFDLQEQWKVEPGFLYMRQAQNNEFNFGAIASYFLKEQNVYVKFGTYYRWADAAILHFGVEYQEYTMGLSYDINVSSLTVVSRTYGGFEISLIYKRKAANFIPSF